MNASISQFMKMALTVIVISALLFFVGYKLVNDEITGTGGYQKTVEGVEMPTTAAPRTTR
ncbi:hypothetical protein B14911_10627 [Bacillus sp. NRRL B-14911]|uniref:hypothetical protein n=1 Tax=Bacillus sp. NRRL B-14911 TaxID=313627 RepID=UPI00006B5954|nr:hypothetical protein [Bacillus sp. NRRL B-14911]EAR66183.1 hypothetical protein B14911_10627 [Bacillus sp. NRRL B-14911]